ncbi:MAG: hypothetical protein IJM96_07005 [Clostridia bacterium]|nr:hypothetical protein [Clostridia bacterium]
MKRLAILLMMTMLLLCTACSERYEITSFDQIPDAFEEGFKMSPALSKAIAEFVFAQPDDVMFEEIKRIASGSSDDDFKITDMSFDLDNTLLEDGKRATTNIIANYVVEVKPDAPGEGILQKCEEWQVNRMMTSKIQYNLRVYKENFTFVNTENGNTLEMEGAKAIYAHKHAPDLPKDEQKTLNIVNKFVDKNSTESGKNYRKLLLGNLGMKDGELFIRMHLTATGMEQEEIDAMFNKLADELKGSKYVKTYMNGSTKIRMVVERNSITKDLEYIFEV